MNSLSLEEKAALLTGKGTWHTNDCNGKLPSILMTDGPHGLRKQDNEQTGSNNNSRLATCFPCESAIACSWSTEAVAKMASAIGSEALAEQVSVVLGCGVNIKRSPLCGRNFEYFSEDPFLSGKLAASYIKAMQGLGVGTSLKHFAGNSQETHRQTSNSEIDERALREIYLTAFEIAIKESSPATVMASYNLLNGEYACANKELLTDILRKEWGYKGTVISDWSAVVDPVRCIKAGLDLEMPDNLSIHGKQLLRALADKTLSRKELDRAVSNVIKLVNDYKPKKEPVWTDYKKQHAIAKELACESAVLLKNNDFLPLKPPSKILVVGDMAVHMRYQGGGSSHIHTAKTPNAVQSLIENGMEVVYAKGYDENTDSVNRILENAAVELAKTKIPILFFGGLPEHYEGEGYDRKTLSIPRNQLRLFDRLYEVNPQIAFISFSGSAIDLPFASKAQAILQMYLCGQAAGEACADLIVGKSNPSGKLAETFPLSLSDIPSHEWFGTGSDDVEYRESIFVGYRYYDTYHKPVRFPFGHGLSYTTFEYSDLQTDTDTFVGGTFPVSFTITNTGNVSGMEIAQVYVQNPDCNYLRAKRELRGFTKVSLAPGEQKRVTVTLSDRSFSVFDEKEKTFLMPSGTYQILVSASLNDPRLKKTIAVKGIDYARDDRKKISEYLSQKGTAFSISREQFERLYGRPLRHLDNTQKGGFTIANSLDKLSKHSLLARITLRTADKMVTKMFKGKRQDDPEVMMLRQGLHEGTLDSVVCQSDGMIPYKLAEAIVLSANGHPFQSFFKLIH
ncbi:MAG: glycosyl hydrolase [Lachnospiraceae bacterium]|nr:glycosyl hydrolase [Lachnospiraceae bacterium]